MNDNANEKGELLTDGERLTIFGRFLRSSSLDELPTLCNVLVGHMSLVGPRPLLVKYLDRYSDHQLRRLEVKPGLTGWAQINGRDELPIPEKVALDVEYLERQSFWFDMYILWLTVLKVLRRDGITH